MSKEIATKEMSALEALKASYPQDPGDSYEKTHLPQVRFKAKTVLDDDDKVVLKAGTYVIVTRSEEQVDGKYEYPETVLGAKFTGDIIYSRYRLSFYDAANNAYVSSPIFDDKENEVVKLFTNGKQVASGTARELQALPEYQMTVDDKVKTSLKMQKVLYVLIGGVLHEVVVGGGNVFGLGNYVRDLTKEANSVASVHTEFSSEKAEYGGNKYNQMTFSKVAELSEEEAVANVAVLKDLLDGIKAEKAFYGNTPAATPALPEGDDF